ncbi:hypothetical protein CDLVIII_5305 [Clostridium sp. DL-VIII]|uniref:PqqD family protein n=1 Tax=Clostridium sp. DL-VIII TaxID=641107 RepID=UPI00023B02ED|nr:PqqD family protein [Clostridium sp. DL-VIII]EHJ01787.1 hypothetical protein CDLVIII_5305 [Clostridium sp. DL-VIII]
MEYKQFLDKLKDKDLNNYYPIFQKEKIVVDEKNCNYQLVLSNYDVIYLSEVAYEILKYCNGENSISEIIDILFNIYDVEKINLKNDILITFYELWNNTVVEWKDKKNIFSSLYMYSPKIGVEYKVPIFQEIIKRLKDEHSRYIFNSHYNKLVKFSKPYLEKGIKFLGTLYFDCYDNDKLKFSIAYTPVYSYLTGKELLGFNIEYILILDDDIEFVKENLGELLKWSMTFINLNSLKARTDRLFFQIELSSENGKIDFLSSLGFSKNQCNKGRNIIMEKLIKY